MKEKAAEHSKDQLFLANADSLKHIWFTSPHRDLIFMLAVIFTSVWYHSCSFTPRWLICKEYAKQWWNLPITSDQALDGGGFPI